jgi:hypothetical protein
MAEHRQPEWPSAQKRNQPYNWFRPPWPREINRFQFSASPQKKSHPQPPAQLPVGGVAVAGLLVAAGVLVSIPAPGLVISGAGGGGGGVEGAGGVVAGGGISGSAEVDGALLFPAPGEGDGGVLLLEPDWPSVA